MPPHRDKIKLCNEALNSVAKLISRERYQDVHDHINQYDEWGLGTEFLIDWLIEDEIKITRDQFEKIEAAMNAMGMGDTGRVKGLETLVAK